MGEIDKMRLRSDIDRDVSSSIKYDIARGEQESAWERLHFEEEKAEQQKKLKEDRYKERMRERDALVSLEQEKQKQAELAADQKKQSDIIKKKQESVEAANKLREKHARRADRKEADSPYMEFKSSLKF